jgi:hypothetical protein
MSTSLKQADTLNLSKSPHMLAKTNTQVAGSGLWRSFRFCQVTWPFCRICCQETKKQNQTDEL